MKTIGILLPHTGSSQIAYYSIGELNNLQKYDKIIFFEQLTNPILPIGCGTMCLNNLMSFKGILITTTIENTILARKLINPNSSLLYFYVWDLEWLRRNKQDYMKNIQAYLKADRLIARHKSHADAINNYCNRYPDVVENFNLEEILEK